MKYFLGLDGGGTSCRSMVIDENEDIVFEGIGGPANFATNSISEVQQSISDALRECPPVEGVVGCFAGIVDKATELRAVSVLESLLPGSKVATYPDYYALLEAAPKESHLLVISGTGSVVCSRTSDGVSKSGGGGYLLGDQGSCFDIGRRLVQSLCVDLSPGPAELWDAIAEVYGRRVPSEVISAVYQAQPLAGTLARLAPAVILSATLGHELTSQIVRDCMSDLARLVNRHCEQFLPELQTVEVCLAGGLWANGDWIQAQFLQALTEKNDNFAQSGSGCDPNQTFSRHYSLVRLIDPPVFGAAKLARKMNHGN